MVRCLVCGREFTRIPPAHLKSHGISGYKEYKKLFPNAKTGFEGENNPFYGKRHTEETKKKIGEKSKGRTPWNKGRRGYTYEEIYGEEKAKLLKELRRQKAKERWKDPNDPFNRTGKEPFNKGKPWSEWMSPDGMQKAKKTQFRKGHIPWNKGIPFEVWAPPELVRKLEDWRKSERCKYLARKALEYINKVLMKDPEFRSRVIKNWWKVVHGKPNKAEKWLGRLINKVCPNEYRYNDGWFILAGKIPDFVNVNGKKKLIELFGELWHTKEEEEERINFFKQYGWDCLVIWYEELIHNQPKVMEKIYNFTYGGDYNES
ncbi:MAG TPA: DUF559 domain-containing protein [Deltaproteobacteria bacterium]|nr:DUF559 domain-containing protein [Deltaproteobacteria bacterium]